MKINLNVNNVNVVLESDDNNSLMNVLNLLMNANERPEPSTQTNIRNEMREYLTPVIPVQAPVQTPRYSFIPASDKQKKLLRSIPEYKNANLDAISKSEASMAIEKWNKSRSYHYKDHY